MPRYARARSLLLGATVLVSSGLVASACSSTGGNAAAHGTDPPTTMDMGPTASPPTTGEYGSTPGSAPAATPGSDPAAAIAGELAKARAATARYSTDLDAAKADGYRIITPMMTDMGYHFLNSSVQGFDVEKPPILVYERAGDAWQLAALEWIFPEPPATPPLEGASYGSFPAACHYDDGTFVAAEAQAQCAATSPETGSPFVFWHPPLVTMHVWIWYPNPDGLFASMNPLIGPFDTPSPTQRPGHAV
jgi:hypothetical protein